MGAQHLNRWFLPSAVAAAILVGTVFASSPGREALRQPRATLVAMLASANILDLNHAQSAGVPGPTEGLVPLKSLRGSIQFFSPHYFADRDGWGRDLLYWSNGYDYMLVSFGADGEPDFDYSGWPPYRDVPHGVRTTEPEQDIVIVSGSVRRGPAFRTLGRSTARSMRALAIAIETYAIDNNDYPFPHEGTVVASFLDAHLVPTYIRVLPLHDEWENPLLYWSDARSYPIISTGADGVRDEPYSDWDGEDYHAFQPIRPDQPARDILLVDFAFEQWPRGATE